MEFQVTFDIFSGRPNPVIHLAGDDATELLKRLQPASKTEAKTAAAPLFPILGYRGMIIEAVSPAAGISLPARSRVIDSTLFAAERSYRTQDADVEQFILDRSAITKNTELPPELIAIIREEIKSRRAARAAIDMEIAGAGPVAQGCPCAPLYEPDWWNDNGQRQLHNNCYNYACNYRTDTFAQPGRASGDRIREMSCNGVRPMALADGLLDYAQKIVRCPQQGHLVALAIWPRWDYHWYRMGQNGLWSHKPGSWAVTDLDNSGHRIGKPATADRGRYTDFCGYMIVMHGHIKLQ